MYFELTKKTIADYKKSDTPKKLSYRGESEEGAEIVLRWSFFELVIWGFLFLFNLLADLVAAPFMFIFGKRAK